ncbi:hypothetical protein DEF23_21460 [Marinitenerispora sediminis]|uniref:Uncharacterized protein n=1 Tax=Marinitenerispora sediminis TaxID=1931232 RepID=A0A368T0X3_9ACTN|nr:hypothetical protein DEF23_21460 [Marinitenerispora sediminis]RCV51289.1 hypothetical protein DEF28_15740 [Marinitenerispora sediminis]RCV52887.1 hypothetical protein DEF24_21320 [Marinitenerispora sediminis]
MRPCRSAPRPGHRSLVAVAARELLSRVGRAGDAGRVLAYLSGDRHLRVAAVGRVTTAGAGPLSSTAAPTAAPRPPPWSAREPTRCSG